MILLVCKVYELKYVAELMACDVDVDTRRRAACDLVRALCKSFEAPVIQIFSSYVQHMLLVCISSTSLHVQSVLNAAARLVFSARR